MENGKIRPLADPIKILKQVITSTRRPLCKISCKSVHWGLLGKGVKYNGNFSVLNIPLLNGRPTGQTDQWIFKRMAQISNDAVSRMGVPF